MRLSIKICGLRERPHLEAALAEGADMVGFVFFASSPRNLSLDAARDLVRQVEGRARTVALTADADDTTMDAIMRIVAPDMLQLHGRETSERVRAIRERFDVPVIRALSIGGRSDLARVAEVEEVSDHLLFDARPPAGADRPGGNGLAFDWRILRDLVTHRPWLLAGGLTPENVAAALRASGARGVDVSSGVECAPGRKDVELIRRFVAAVRSVET